MTLIPGTDQERNDAIDFLIDGMQDIVYETDDLGKITRKTEFNPEPAWYKGHLINQPFGRHALLIKRLETLAKTASYFMSSTLSKPVSEFLLLVVDEYKRSIDAKSSETYRDKHNNQNALLNILTNKSVERKYTLRGEGTQGIIDSILHRDRAKDEQNG